MKICIVGAGISGLSIANLLKSKHETTVYEKESTSGGLIKCTREDGVLFHRVGGHVFNSKNKEVLDWFWKHFDRKNEFIKATRNAKIYLNKKYIGYPLENHIHKLPKEVVSTIISELLSLNPNKSGDNFAEFLERRFGKTLFNLYFKPYNEKLWNTDLSQIPLDWLEGKLPMPNLKDIIINNIIPEEESEMVHATFYYPKNNGSQFIAERLSQGLNIVTNEQVTSLNKNHDHWIVNDSGKFDKIIYTGDIRALGNIIKGSKPDGLDAALSATKDFKSNATSNVLCYTDSNDLSWLYLPEKDILPHRIIYTGNFSQSNNTSKRQTCVVEFSGKIDHEMIVSELHKLPGNLEPIAFNFEPNSYVINTFGTRQTVNRIKNNLEPQGLHLLGRFAEWEYYNMDKAIEAAMDLKLTICK